MKKGLKINLVTLLLIVCLITIVVMGFFIFRFYNDSKTANAKVEKLNSEIAGLKEKLNGENNIKKSTKDDIDFFEIQTHEYFEEIPPISDYCIDSEEELDAFYEIYSDEIDLDNSYLEDNTIFIKVGAESSGSIEKKLKDVAIKRGKVIFDIESDDPETATDDMAFWYFIAIIPNEKIEDLYLTEWSKPSDVLKEIKESTPLGDADNNVDYEDKVIIAKKEYANMAWGYQNEGTVIFSDGSIYSWDVNDDSNDAEGYSINKKEGLESFLIEKCEPDENKVSNDDLKEIKKLIRNLQDSKKTEQVAYDAGETTISVFDADDNEFELKITGDYEGGNETENAQELLKILEKYL